MPADLKDWGRWRVGIGGRPATGGAALRSTANGLGWEPTGGRVRRIPLGRDPADGDDGPRQKQERTRPPHEHERVGFPASALALCQGDTEIVEPSVSYASLWGSST